MPSLSHGLEQALHRAIRLGTERHHEYATLEHLLLALLDDKDASRMVRGCSVDLEELKNTLTRYVDKELSTLVVEGSDDAKPTAAFQRLVQRAVLHVQNSGGDVIRGDHVIIALISERESNAAYFLQEQGMSRLDAIKFMESPSSVAADAPHDTKQARRFVFAKPAPGLTLSIEHPEADLVPLGSKLGLRAFRCWNKGDPRMASDGQTPEGMHLGSHCSFQFVQGYDHALPNGLRVALSTLARQKELLDQLTDTGGKLTLFISWSGQRNEEDILDWTILQDLADLRIALHFGSYRL